MAPESETKPQAKHGRRPQGILSISLQSAAMAAAITIFFLLAAASTALLLALVAAARASRRHRGSRYCVLSASPQPSPPPPPPPHRGDLLRRIPSFAFPETHGGDESSSSAATCAVCLEAGRGGERWRAMPACRHAFHAACVDRWLARSPACPLCRAAVVTAPTS
ncbi:unnamed protein product [Urochloa humidicola]